MSFELGHQTRFGFKKNTNGWGGLPMAIGSGDGIRVDSDSLDPNSALIKRPSIFGSAFRMPGVAGNKTPGGDLEIPLFYRGSELRLLAQLIGSDTVSVVSTAQRHALQMVQNHAGIVGTLADFGLESVREYACAKVAGGKLAWDQSNQLGKMTASVIAQDENQNVGAADAAFVVASVAVGTGAKTVLAAALVDFQYSPLTFTKDAATTAINVTIAYIDLYENLQSVTFTETSFVSNVWTSSFYVRRVVSVTVNSFTGTGNISAGVSNGVNKTSGASSVTEDSLRDSVVFSQSEFQIKPQGDAADFLGNDSADEQYVSAFSVEIKANYDQRVTSRYGRLIDEPSTGGSGDFFTVMFGMNFTAEDNKNKKHLLDVYTKNKLRAKILFTGPQIPTLAVSHRLAIWLNNIQFEKGSLQLKGPGGRPFDLSGECHVASSLPTGFPTGATQPCFIEIFNGDSTAYYS